MRIFSKRCENDCLFLGAVKFTEKSTRNQAFGDGFDIDEILRVLSSVLASLKCLLLLVFYNG